MDKDLEKLRRNAEINPDDPYVRLQYHLALRKAGKNLPPVPSKWIEASLVEAISSRHSSNNLRYKIQGNLVLLSGYIIYPSSYFYNKSIIATGLPWPDAKATMTDDRDNIVSIAEGNLYLFRGMNPELTINGSYITTENDPEF